jgi:hypothetical protein
MEAVQGGGAGCVEDETVDLSVVTAGKGRGDRSMDEPGTHQVKDVADTVRKDCRSQTRS